MFTTIQSYEIDSFRISFLQLLSFTVSFVLYLKKKKKQSPPEIIILSSFFRNVVTQKRRDLSRHRLLFFIRGKLK